MLHEEYTKKETLSIFITKAIFICSPNAFECGVVAVLATETDLQAVFACSSVPMNSPASFLLPVVAVQIAYTLHTIFTLYQLAAQ